MINNDYSRSAYPLQKRTESCPLTYNFYFCTVSCDIEGQESTMDVCVWQEINKDDEWEIIALRKPSLAYLK